VGRPGADGAEARQFLFHLGDLGGEVVAGVQVLAHVQLFGSREVQTGPPGAVLGGKRIALRGGQIVALQHTMQAIGGLRAGARQAFAVRHQLAQLAHGLRRHPDLWDEVKRQELGQHLHIALVGLDQRRADQLDVRRVGHHRAGVARGLVIEGPGVGGRFDDHFVGGQEVGAKPHFQLGPVETTWRQHQLARRVDAADDHVVLVGI